MDVAVGGVTTSRGRVARAWDRRGETVRASLPRIVAGLVLLVLFLYHAGSILGWAILDGLHPTPIVHGISALVLVWAFYSLATNRGFIWNAINGLDERPSTSIFQAFIWSAAIIYAYVAVGAKAGTIAVVVPPDLLLAMGLTVATYGSARFITARNDGPSRSGRKQHHQPGGWRYLYLDDQDRVNFGKLQLLSWTLVAVGLFLVSVTTAITQGGTDMSADLLTTDGAVTLPNLGVALVLLQGLGTATYLGDKLVPAVVGSIADVAPRLIEPNGSRLITVTGTGFGATREATMVLLDGEPQTPSSWSDTRIEFTVAAAKANNSPYPTDRDLELRVGGAAPWVIRIATDPVVGAVLPVGGLSIGNPGQCTVNGADFGDRPGRILVATTRIAADAWGATAIIFKLPAVQQDGSPWAPGALDLTIERADKRKVVQAGGLTLIA